MLGQLGSFLAAQARFAESDAMLKEAIRIFA